MTEPMNRNGSDRNVIDGSPVIAREQARLWVPLSRFPDGLSPVTGVDKCLLEDGREVHQCASLEDRTCNWWHEKGESVRAHLRSHTERTKFKIAKLKEERDELLAKAEQRNNNYRAGAIKAAATKRANRENSNANTENGNEDTMSASAKDRQKKIDMAQTSLEGVVEGLDTVRTVLANITKTVSNVGVTLEALAVENIEASAIDPVLADKAARWDAMQGLFNKS